MISIRKKTPKARKNHLCNFCELVISKGTVYDNQTNIFDGQIYTWKTHLECTKLADELKMYDYVDEGLSGEDFQEYIKEEFCRLESEKLIDLPASNFEEILIVVKLFHLNK